METIKEELVQIFLNSCKWNDHFSDKLYMQTFQDFKESNHSVFTAVGEYLSALSEEMQASGIQELAKQFVFAAVETMETVPAKKGKEKKQIDLNMLMAVYFLPAIRDEKMHGAEELTEEICRLWSLQFKEGKIQASDAATIEAGFHKKMCYITTAVCASLQKPADCYELNLLKTYRDGFLSETPEGRRLIEQYYDIAPTIVKRIEKSGHSKEIYQGIWKKYLAPCIDFIEREKNQECRRLYVEMVESLHRKYMEEYYES